MGKKNRQKVKIKSEIGLKFDDNKLPMHLISPVFLESIAGILRLGAKKYGDRNWEKGIDYSRVYAATIRHLVRWWGREDTDKESNRNHLAHAACCLMFLIHYTGSDRFDEFDDRP